MYSYTLSVRGQIIDVRLLGIVSAVFTQADTGEIIPAPAPPNAQATVSFQQVLDLGIVFKSRLIRETIGDFGRQNGLLGAA